jgi:predicted DNA binding CopG/RHH family protein
MTKRKVKTVAPPKSSVEETKVAETVVLPNAESEIATEPSPKKMTHAAKRTATLQPVTPVAEDPVDSSTPKQARSTKETAKSQVLAPVAEESAPTAKKSAKEKDQTSDKVKKMKRLTLDIPKPLHKAIKAQAVEEGISIVDMLRTLLEQHYSK